MMMDPQDFWDGFYGNLKKLKRNVGQWGTLSEADQKKYAPALEKLKTSTRKGAEVAAYHSILADMPMGDDWEEELPGIQEAIGKAGISAGAGRAVSRLMEDFDLDRFVESLSELRDRLWDECYAPYWEKHCRPCEGVSSLGGRVTYWNDLTGAKWDEDHGIWEDDGGCCWSLYLPPKKEDET